MDTRVNFVKVEIPMESVSREIKMRIENEYLREVLVFMQDKVDKLESENKELTVEIKKIRKGVQDRW